jgi:hypothetical protein
MQVSGLLCRADYPAACRHVACLHEAVIRVRQGAAAAVSRDAKNPRTRPGSAKKAAIVQKTVPEME